MDGFSGEAVSSHVALTKGRRQFEDMLGTCVFCTRVPLQHVVDLLNLVTGWDFTPKEAQEAGFRAANLLRAFNIRHGLTPELEYPSERWSSTPTDGPIEGVSIRPHWDAMLDNYYSRMGWDRESGKPLRLVLWALGLEHVGDDLWGKGRARE
jgi:aldehyde:ferredoxin oxidoreductase